MRAVHYRAEPRIPAPPPVRSRVRAGTHELAALVAVGALTTLKMRSIADSRQLQLFLYNGDSLTLPILRQSFARHDPFHPVLSTQLLIFPEGFLYALCSVLTTSIRASLLLNAYINVLFLYVLLRSIASYLVKGGRPAERAAAVGCCLLYFCLTLLERNNGPLLATLFLLTTYYSGVVLGGLFSILVALRQLGSPDGGTRRRTRGVALGAIVVVGLISFSDPLFLLEVSAPFLVTIVVLLARQALTARRAALLGGTHLGGVAVGYLLRLLCRRFYGSSVEAYLKANQIHVALDALGATLQQYWESDLGRVTLTLIGIPICWAGLRTAALARRSTRAGHPGLTGPFLVSVFGIVAPLTISAGVVLTGNSTLRYFIPLTVFPVVAAMPLADVVFLRTPRSLSSSAGALVCGVLMIAALLAVPQMKPLLSESSFPDEQCLTRALGGRAANGLGNYWIARGLDVYNTHRERVLQIIPPVNVFPWLINVGTYERKSYSFVLIDRMTWPVDMIVAGDVATLGPPSDVKACTSFYVYEYRPGSSGYNLLNATVDVSIKAALAIKR